MRAAELVKLLQALPPDREVMLMRDDFPRRVTGLEEATVGESEGHCWVSYYPEVEKAECLLRTVTILRSR